MWLRRDRDPDRLPVADEARQRGVEPLQRLVVAADHAAVQAGVGLDDRAFGPVGGAELRLQRQRASRQGKRLGHAAEVALDRRQVRGQRRQLGDVAQRLRRWRSPAAARTRCRAGAGPRSARRRSRPRSGRAARRSPSRSTSAAVRLDDGQRFAGAARLREADRMQPRGLEARPRRVEAARQLAPPASPRRCRPDGRRPSAPRSPSRSARRRAGVRCAPLASRPSIDAVRVRSRRARRSARGCSRSARRTRLGGAGPVEGSGREAPALDLVAALRAPRARAAPPRRTPSPARAIRARRPSAARRCRAAPGARRRCAAMRRCSSRAIGSGTDARVASKTGRARTRRRAGPAPSRARATARRCRAGAPRARRRRARR